MGARLESRVDTIYGLAARIISSDDVDDRNKRRVREILRLVDLIAESHPERNPEA